MRLAPLACIGALVLGCAREAPSAAVVTVPAASTPSAASAAPVEPKPAPAPVPAPAAPTASQCEDSLPPDDMLEHNLADTSMSGLAEIVSSSKTDLDGKSPPPSKGYVSFRYEVRVLEWFAGTGPEHLVLTQGAEAEFNPKRPGALLFFSACAKDATSGYEPDVGYFFPLDPACHAEAQARGAAAAKRVPKKAKGTKPAACKG